jgi:hypothetical protein
VPGRIYGRVARYDIDRIREFKSLEPIPSVRVSLDLPAGRVTTASDQWGRFRFADVPPGQYAFSVDAGQGLTPWGQNLVILPDRAACVASQIVLQPSGRVSGQVLTSDVGEGSTIELDRPFVLPAPLATRTFRVSVTCRDGSLPAAVSARASAPGARFAEFDESGDGPVRTLNLVRD